MKQKLVIGGALFVIAAGAALYFFWFNPSRLGSRILPLRAWLNNPGAHTDWSIEAKTRCGEAPFLMPSSGYIGFIWHDSFRPGHQHQGIDIFGGAEPGLYRFMLHMMVTSPASSAGSPPSLSACPKTRSIQVKPSGLTIHIWLTRRVKVIL